MATHLPDLVQFNDLVPRIQTRDGYLGKDGLQEAHIQGTRFAQREMAELLEAIDPGGSRPSARTCSLSWLLSQPLPPEPASRCL